MSRIGAFADDDAAAWVVKSPDIGVAMAGFTNAVYTQEPAADAGPRAGPDGDRARQRMRGVPEHPRLGGHRGRRRRGPLRPRGRVADLAGVQPAGARSPPSSRSASPATTPVCATTRTSGNARNEQFDDELLTDLALSCAMWLGMGRMLRTLDIGQSCKITL